MGDQRSGGSNAVPPNAAKKTLNQTEPYRFPAPEPQKGAISAGDGGTGNSMELGGGKKKMVRADGSDMPGT